MDEDQYRKVYHELNPNRCVFEKSINNRRCDCERKHRFLIATREGIACRSEQALANCTLLLNTLRNKSRFALKIITVNGPLPHNKELKVQAGGMFGLQKIMATLPTKPSYKVDETVHNIHQTVGDALKKYNHIEELPYSDIVKDIVIYQVRKKRR
jgi:hypothetical protein